MPDTPRPTPAASFDDQHRALVNDTFRELAQKAIAGGADPADLAQVYSEKGKPDFALAYLLASNLPDQEKRDILASAYENRAAQSEQWAKDSEARYSRPFPLVHLEAQKDRANARSLRAGKAARRESKAARQLNININIKN
ncbi:MAG TPA: hypothetical protein VH590_16665 [Ktedonobacterales bacterium]